MNAFSIYLWGIADGLIDASILLSFIIGIAHLITRIIHLISDSNGSDLSQVRELSNKLLLGFLVSLAIATLTPNSKTIAAMVIIPEIVKSDAVKRDLPELYDMAIKKLKDELTSTTDKQ